MLKSGRWKTRKVWLAAENEKLRRIYPHYSTVETAKKMGRSVASINGQAPQLGLHKTAAYLASPAACRLRREDSPGIRFRFKPGHVPFNKGMKGWKAGGRSAETQFKKGQRSANYLPIGTTKKDSDGYPRIKVADGLGGFGNRKVWDFVHRRVWEVAHGPIPKGHRLWWKDRNRDNCALENLELLSDVEHMARTTIHNLSPELVRAILMKGALTRRIREMEERKTDGKKQTDRPARPSVRNSGRTQGQAGAGRHQPRQGRREHRAGHHRLGQAGIAVPRHDRAGAAKRIPRAAKG